MTQQKALLVVLFLCLLVDPHISGVSAAALHAKQQNLTVGEDGGPIINTAELVQSAASLSLRYTGTVCTSNPMLPHGKINSHLGNFFDGLDLQGYITCNAGYELNPGVATTCRCPVENGACSELNEACRPFLDYEPRAERMLQVLTVRGDPPLEYWVTTDNVLSIPLLISLTYLGSWLFVGFFVGMASSPVPSHRRRAVYVGFIATGLQYLYATLVAGFSDRNPQELDQEHCFASRIHFNFFIGHLLGFAVNMFAGFGLSQPFYDLVQKIAEKHQNKLDNEVASLHTTDDDDNNDNNNDDNNDDKDNNNNADSNNTKDLEKETDNNNNNNNKKNQEAEQSEEEEDDEGLTELKSRDDISKNSLKHAIEKASAARRWLAIRILVFGFASFVQFLWLAEGCRFW